MFKGQCIGKGRNYPIVKLRNEDDALDYIKRYKDKLPEVRIFDENGKAFARARNGQILFPDEWNGKLNQKSRLLSSKG